MICNIKAVTWRRCAHVQAAYLQRGGLKTAVLERRHVLGGAAVTEEIIPGKVDPLACWQ